MPPLPVISVSVTDFPEVIRAVRRELADALRAGADADPSPAVAARLRAIADGFEAGQRGKRQ